VSQSAARLKGWSLPLAASPDGDDSLLLGWAGWDHKDRAQTVVNLVLDRSDESGWSVDKITPLLAGLAEVMPWVMQWHGEFDKEWYSVPAEEFAAFLTDQCSRFSLRQEDLTAWRPPASTRGRRAAAV